jgi:hypothetical protein
VDRFRLCDGAGARARVSPRPFPVRYHPSSFSAPSVHHGCCWRDLASCISNVERDGQVELTQHRDKEITTRVIDDTDASITYSPEWQLRPGSENGYYNVSAHVTNTAGADLTFE